MVRHKATTVGQEAIEVISDANGVRATSGLGGLTEGQVEQLRQIAQPLLFQYKVTQAAISGFLVGAGVVNTGFNLDLDTGTVSLIPPRPSPNGTEAG